MLRICASITVAAALVEAQDLPLVSAAFGSGMVLQREPASAQLFGWTTPHQQVTVTLDNATTVTADSSDDGKWLAELPPTKAGSGHHVRVVGQNATVILEDVAFGEVWGCGGQSNMAFSVWMMGTGDAWKGHPAWDADEIIADSINYPNLRLMTVSHSSKSSQEALISQPWSRASPALLNDTEKWGNFSAVCYLSGRDLLKKLGGDVPVGMISSNVGGTMIQRWTPPDIIKQCDDGIGSGGDLYNGMIAPLTSVKFKGWLWYQGEQNIGAGRDGGFPGHGGEFYACAFHKMIGAWRDAFNAESMPFLFVQLAAFRDGYHYNITNQSIAEIREAQASALDLPMTGMATAFDLGMGGGVHPSTKTEVGSRTASVMNAVAYGSHEVYEGPAPVKAVQQDDVVIITFDMHGSKGWNAHEGQNCSYSRHGGAPSLIEDYYCKSYEVKGPDGAWQDADFIQIDASGAVNIRSPISDPVAIRYGWSDYPIVNLYSEEGFPTPPFQMEVSVSNMLV